MGNNAGDLADFIIKPIKEFFKMIVPWTVITEFIPVLPEKLLNGIVALHSPLFP
jgi:hypothetical protein